MHLQPHWIDTHCHLDAAEFAGPGDIGDIEAVRARASVAGVVHCVLPAVNVANFSAVQALAHRFGDSYALGIHPLCVPEAHVDDLQTLDNALTALSATDPRLVAVGEIGLDHFVPELKDESSPLWEKQAFFYRAQLRLARKHGLPVLLHVRRSADRLLKYLREVGRESPQPFAWRGIAHAFNGSDQQAQAFVALGFKLGFGGTVTFAAARQIRHLAATLPLDALVVETDAPDIPPQWRYLTAAQRSGSATSDAQPQGRNEPGELPRIAAVIATLRGLGEAEFAAATTANAMAALPKLAGLLKTASSRENAYFQASNVPPAQ